MKYCSSFYCRCFLFFFILLFISSLELIAQINGNKIQRGVVRLQSFVGQNPERIAGAVISTSIKGTNDAISDSLGIFKLSLNKPSIDQSFYITSVLPPKNSRNDLELMLPLTTDRQEYTSHDLVIVMSSKSERDAYVKQEVAKVKANSNRLYEKKIKELNKKIERGELENSILRDSLSQFDLHLRNQDQYLERELKRIAEHTDFELSDSINKAVAIALYEGNIDLALKLFKQSEAYYDQLENENIERKKLLKEEEAKSLNIDKNIQIRALQGIQTAYLHLDFNLVKQIIQKRLDRNPLSREWLTEMGQLEELIYNNYAAADSLYRQALKLAISDNANADMLADLCNKIADVHYMQSKYEQAEGFYYRALNYLKTAGKKDNKAFYDAYAGLGILKETFGRFDEAEKYYKCLVEEEVRITSTRAHLIGSIGLAQLMFERGRIQEAQQKFESLINYIEEDETIDLDLRVQAYMDYVECLYAYGRNNKAIKTCDQMLNYVQSHSAGANYYMCEILIHRAIALYNEGIIPEATENMNRSMDICKNILGDKHPKNALLYAYIAKLAQEMGDMEHAKEFTDKALFLFEQKFGLGSLNSVTALQMLINCYIISGDYEKAIETIELIRNIYKEFDINNPLWIADLKIAQSRIDTELGNHKQAEKLIDEVIDTYCSIVGSDCVNLVPLYNQKGVLAKTANKMYEWYAKAEKITAKIWGENSKQMAFQRVNDAIRYFEEGAFQKYEEVCLEAERRYLEVYGGENYNMVPLFDQLSTFYEKMMDFKKAETYRIRSCSATREAFGNSHPYFAIRETSLGLLYQKIGKYEEGKKMIMHADSILTNKFGVNHKNTFNSQLAICNALANMGKIEDALSHIEKIRENVIDWYGKDNILYANAIGYYSLILGMKGETKNAIQYAKEMLSIYEKIEFNDRTILIETNNQLSTFYCNIGDMANAIRYNEKALTLANDYYGKDAFGTMPVLFSKASLLANNKEKIKEAKQIFQKVHKAYSNKYGVNSPETFSIALVIANIKMAEGDFEDSVGILEEMKENIEKTYGKESINLCKVLDNLGNAYMLTDSIEVGINLLKRSLELLEAYYGSYSPNTLEPLNALTNAYMNNGDIMNAKVYANRARIVAKEFYGYDSPLFASIDAKYSILMLQEGNAKNAYKPIEHYNKIMKKAVKEERASEVYLCESYFYLAKYYHAMAMMARNSGDNTKAERQEELALSHLYEQLKISSAYYGEESSQNIGCLSEIASIYSFIQKSDSAIVYAQKSFDLTSYTYGEKSIQTAYAYSQLANAYSLERDSLGNIPFESLSMAESYTETAIDIFKDIFSKNKEKFVQTTFMNRVALVDIKEILQKNDEIISLVDNLLEDIDNLPYTDNRLIINCKLLFTKASAFANSLDEIPASESFEEAMTAYNALPIQARNAITKKKHEVAIKVYFCLQEKQKWNEECKVYLDYLKLFPNTESLQKSFLEYKMNAESQFE